MSKYSDIIKEYIQKSHLSLSEIEKELRKRGFNKNKSYLSNLQNGKVEPPSPNISIALAEIVDVDPVRLILTPLLESMKKSKPTNDNNFIKDVPKVLFSCIATLADIYKEEFSQYMVDYFDDTFDKEELINFLNYEVMRKNYDELPEEEIMQMFLPIESNTKQLDNQSEELSIIVTSDEEQYVMECLKIYRKMRLKPNKKEI